VCPATGLALAGAPPAKINGTIASLRIGNGGFAGCAVIP